MPYFIHVPGIEKPYLLDDEDAHYLTFFYKWGWPVSNQHEVDHPLVIKYAYSEQKRRPSLYTVWEKECIKREHKEEKVAKAAKKEAKREEKAYIDQINPNKRTTRFLGMKDSKRATTDRPQNSHGYKNGIYVNHLENLQKKWVGEVEEEQRMAAAKYKRF